MAFNDFLRGLPYVKTTVSRVDTIEFENGAEQRRDLWLGRTRETFDIRFNVNTKTEILAVRDFFVSKLGQTFPFIDPVSGTTYTVKFVANSFQVERRFFGTYFGSCQLQEVF